MRLEVNRTIAGAVGLPRPAAELTNGDASLRQYLLDSVTSSLLSSLVLNAGAGETVSVNSTWAASASAASSGRRLSLVVVDFDYVIHVPLARQSNGQDSLGLTTTHTFLRASSLENLIDAAAGPGGATSTFSTSFASSLPVALGLDAADLVVSTPIEDLSTQWQIQMHALAADGGVALQAHSANLDADIEALDNGALQSRLKNSGFPHNSVSTVVATAVDNAPSSILNRPSPPPPTPPPPQPPPPSPPPPEPPIWPPMPPPHPPLPSPPPPTAVDNASAVLELGLPALVGFGVGVAALMLLIALLAFRILSRKQPVPDASDASALSPGPPSSSKESPSPYAASPPFHNANSPEPLPGAACAVVDSQGGRLDMQIESVARQEVSHDGAIHDDAIAGHKCGPTQVPPSLPQSGIQTPSKPMEQAERRLMEALRLQRDLDDLEEGRGTDLRLIDRGPASPETHSANETLTASRAGSTSGPIKLVDHEVTRIVDRQCTRSVDTDALRAIIEEVALEVRDGQRRRGRNDRSPGTRYRTPRSRNRSPERAERSGHVRGSPQSRGSQQYQRRARAAAHMDPQPPSYSGQRRPVRSPPPDVLAESPASRLAAELEAGAGQLTVSADKVLRTVHRRPTTPPGVVEARERRDRRRETLEARLQLRSHGARHASPQSASDYQDRARMTPAHVRRYSPDATRGMVSTTCSSYSATQPSCGGMSRPKSITHNRARRGRSPPSSEDDSKLWA